MLAAKSCLQIFRRGARTKREHTKEITWPVTLSLVTPEMLVQTVFDVLPKRQNEANEETLIKTMIQDEDNQEKYQTSYSLIDCN
jgi:hypothetical protein